MKTQFLYPYPAGRFSTRMLRIASAGSALLVGAAMPQVLHAEEPAASELSNSITFTAGGAAVSGDSSAFQQRTRSNGDFYGGIEDLEINHQIDDNTTLSLTGHAIPGLEDYGFDLRLDREGLGYVEAGFKQFRTWYDATGGSLLGANMVASNAYGLFDDERSIDRGEIFLEAGLRKEGLPEVTFGYRHLYREGQKDSLCWGDSLSNANWAGSGANVAFKMLPALWDIDETSDIFEIDAEHTFGNTELGAALNYERSDMSNSRYTPRYGTLPNAAPPTASGLANQLLDVNITEKLKSDMFGGHVSSVTRFNDKAWLSFAAAVSNQNSDIDGGTREYGAYWALPGQVIPGPSGGANAKRDYAYDQMTGGSNANQFVTNLNFMWVPVKDLTVTPSLRYENESVDTISNFRAFNTNQSWLGLESLASSVDMDSLAEGLDIRYTGLDNIVLYAEGGWEQEDEDVRRIDRYAFDGAGTADVDLDGEFLNTQVEIKEQKYALGANWYALSNLSFAVEGFHEKREQSLDHNAGNESFASNVWAAGGANNFRPIMTDHNTETDDINLRMTWRPMSNVSLVTRYDYVHTEYENRGLSWSPPAVATFFDLVESGDIASHVVSQSVTWSPLAVMYVQGTVSWISSETDTPEVYTGDSDSDSIVGSLTAGYAIDARTELTATYSYYQAENYTNSVGFTGFDTMGFGYETEEHMISLNVARALTENMTLNVRYAFITSNTTAPDQTGGVNDFDAHMISTGLQVRF